MDALGKYPTPSTIADQPPCQTITVALTHLFSPLSIPSITHYLMGRVQVMGIIMPSI